MAHVGERDSHHGNMVLMWETVGAGIADMQCSGYTLGKSPQMFTCAVTGKEVLPEHLLHGSFPFVLLSPGTMPFLAFSWDNPEPENHVML